MGDELQVTSSLNNGIYAERIDEEHEQDQIHSGPQGSIYRYTTSLVVNVSCKFCSLLGVSTLSSFIC
jgi:hypothetical protein